MCVRPNRRLMMTIDDALFTSPHVISLRLEGEFCCFLAMKLFSPKRNGIFHDFPAQNASRKSPSN